MGQLASVQSDFSDNPFKIYPTAIIAGYTAATKMRVQGATDITFTPEVTTPGSEAPAKFQLVDNNGNAQGKVLRAILMR